MYSTEYTHFEVIAVLKSMYDGQRYPSSVQGLRVTFEYHLGEGGRNANGRNTENQLCRYTNIFICSHLM